MADVERLLRLYSELKEKKDNTVSSHFQDIASVMLPRRTGFSEHTELDGHRLYDEIFDSTPQQAARGLASAIGTMTRPEGQRWFFVRADDTALNDTDEARYWFNEVENRMRSRAFENPSSRFRQATGEADVDLVTFGNACIFAGERTDIRGMLYQTQHLKDVYIVTNADGRIDGVIRRRMFTMRQARQFFGDRAGEKAQDLEERKQSSEKIEYLHFILPREEPLIGRFNTRMPYSSVWIEAEKKQQISESGFMEFPFVTPRFDTTSGEDWGRGPGMVALPDSNMLQAMDETIIVSGQKRVEPPILVPDDGTFNAANTFPGGISYYDADLAREMGRIPIEPLDTGADIAIGLEMQQDRREQVLRAFYKDVLALPVDGPEMTATEVIKRDQEFIRAMGGIFGRLESDYISPLVERTFNVMLRAGAFPEIPEVLQGQNIRFEFESPLKKVRQQIEAAAARQWKDDLLLLAQAKPEVIDMINADEYARFQADANSIPLRIVSTAEQIAATREQRQEMMRQQQEMEAGMVLAEGGEKATRAIKNLAGSQAAA